MLTIFGVPAAAMAGQLVLGLINGAFYAMLSMGLAIIFGLLNIANFAHGAQYMLGAFLAWMFLTYFDIGYWGALVLVPLAVGIIGILTERLLIARLKDADHLYGLLLTFGLALVLQGGFSIIYGSSGMPYEIPALLSGGQRLGFMYVPNYRIWVVAASFAVCTMTWFTIERTKLGSYMRAATENPGLSEAFGINVPLLVTLTYGIGTALAGFAGVLAAPIYQVNPAMGAELLIVVFAVVVVGGMGSIAGSIVTGFVLGLIEAITKVYYPEGASLVIFVIMIMVLMIKPAGIFGRTV